jgi:hypothetical protein
LTRSKFYQLADFILWRSPRSVPFLLLSPNIYYDDFNSIEAHRDILNLNALRTPICCDAGLSSPFRGAFKETTPPRSKKTADAPSPSAPST